MFNENDVDCVLDLHFFPSFSIVLDEINPRPCVVAASPAVLHTFALLGEE